MPQTKRVFQVKLYPAIIQQIGVSPIYTVVCDREEDVGAVILALTPEKDPATAPVLGFIARRQFTTTEIPLDQNGVY